MGSTMPIPAAPTHPRRSSSTGSQRLARTLAVVVVGVMGALIGGSYASATSTSTPYTDPNATGAIGFCDKAGHAITHGSVNAKPFVWRAVSSKPADAPYNVPGRTATLLAYQPRKGLASSDWSGSQLTASTRYANAAHPTAVATAADESLGQFMMEFHPAWQGLLQVRMFLGAPNQTPQTFTYSATSIRIKGSSWSVVNPTPVSCNSGQAVSLETIVLPKTSHPAVGHGGAHRGGATHSSASPQPTSSASAGTGQPGNNTATPATSSAALATPKSAGGGGHGAIVGIGIVLAVIVVAGGGYGALRARKETSS